MKNLIQMERQKDIYSNQTDVHSNQSGIRRRWVLKILAKPIHCLILIAVTISLLLSCNADIFIFVLFLLSTLPPSLFYFFLGKHNSAILTCLQVPFSIPKSCISLKSFANLFLLLNHIKVLASPPQPMLALSPVLCSSPQHLQFLSLSVQFPDMIYNATHCSFFWVYTNSMFTK